MSKDLISIIVPVYNTQQYLDTCINSILSQSYSGDFEIILIDDGSTDSSGELCDSFQLKDNRIIVFHKQNGGLSDARNYGIEKSHGNLICFIDSDDFLHPDYLKVLYELKKKTHADIAECGCFLYYNDLMVSNESKYRDDQILSAFDWLTESRLKDFYSVVAWNKLYEIKLFDSIRYPSNRLFEDEATTYKLIYHSNQIARTYQKLYYYRQRDGSISNTIDANKLDQKILALNEKCNYFEEKNEKEILEFCEAKLCILMISHFDDCDKLYDDDNRKKYFYKTIKKRYIKWIKTSSTVPYRYKLYIRMFLIRNRIWIS